jgi:Tol biopolymer transport system component
MGGGGTLEVAVRGQSGQTGVAFACARYDAHMGAVSGSRRRVVLAAAAWLLSLGTVAAPAGAVAPGTNGPLFYSSLGEIFRIPAGGGSPTNITNTAGNEDRPSVSADGSTVVFHSFETDNFEISRMSGTGAGRVPITTTGSDVLNFEPGISPDGTKVIFQRQTETFQDIWRVDADGGNPVNLTNTPFQVDGTHSDECCAEYSPDASKIAYSNGFNSDPGEAESNDIWVMNADGSNQQALTGPHDAPVQDVGPSWSPDGTKLVFSRTGTGTGDDGLYLIDSDGTDLAPIMNGPSHVDGFAPTFSPDGTLIAFSASNGTISTVPVTGGAPVPVSPAASANYPTWASTSGPPPDTTPPQTTITSGPPSLSNSASASFAFTSSEAGSTFQCKLDGGSFSACVSPKAYSGLGDGAHTFQVRATDAASNVDASPASRTFTVDTASPDTEITSGPGGKTRKGKAKFRFSSSEPGSAFRCKLDGAPFASCTSPQRYSKLDKGKHKFQVVAADPAGNEDPTPAKRRFKVKR